MTPTFCCGLECQASRADGGAQPHWDGKTGSPSIDTSVFRSGAASLLVDTTGGAANAYLQRPAYAAGTRLRVYRFYFRLTTNLSVRTGVLVATGNNGMRIGFHTTGAVYAQAALGTVRDTAGTYADSQWHRVDARFDRTGGTATVTWAVDGVAQTAATSVVAAADMSTLRFGLDGAATGLFRLDDLVETSDTADYPVGDGRVFGHIPIATGSHSFTAGDFQNDASSNLATNETASWGRLEEIPADSTEHVKQVVIRTTGFLEYELEAAKGNTIRAVEVIATVHNLGTGANTQKAVLWDGTTAADAWALASTGSVAGTLRAFSKQFALTPTGLAWTKARFDGLFVRWGYSGDVTTNPALDGLMIEAEFAPEPITATPGVLAMTASRFAPVIQHKIVVPVKALATATFAPKAILGYRPTPGVASLATARFAPTVVAPRRATPGVLTLSLSAFALAVSAPRLVIPGVRAVALAAFAPDVEATAGQDVLVTIFGAEVGISSVGPEPGIGYVPVTATLVVTALAPVVSTPRRTTIGQVALTTSLFAPSVLAPRFVVPGVVALIATRFAPIVSVPRLVTPGQIALATSTFAPAAVLGMRAVPTAAQLVASVFAPSVIGGLRVSPDVQALSTALFAPVVNSPRLVTPDVLGLVLTALAPAVAAPRLVTPATRALILSALAPSALAPRLATPAQLALVLTTFAPAAAATAHITITPDAAQLLTSLFGPIVTTPRLAVPPTASLTLTPFAPSAGAPRLVTPDVAALVLSSLAPTVTAPDNVTAIVSTAVLATAGFAPAITTPQLATPPTKALALTSFAPSAVVPRLVSPGFVSMVLSALAPTVTATDNRRATVGTAALVVSRFAPSLTVPRTVVPATRAVALNAFAPRALAPRLTVPGPLGLTITPWAPTPNMSRSAIPGPLGLTLTAFAPDVVAIFTSRRGYASSGHTPTAGASVGTSLLMPATVGHNAASGTTGSSLSGGAGTGHALASGAMGGHE